MDAVPTNAIPIANFSDGEFVKIHPFPHFTQTSIMPVVAFREHEIRPLGTCFAISNHGLVMTARHVIDEALRIAKWSAESPPLETNGWWVGCLYVAEAEPGDDVPDLVGGILTANKVHLNTNLDVGIMHLNLPYKDDTPIRMPALSMSPGLPKLNAYCFAMGYHTMKCDVAIGVRQTHDLSQSYSCTRGKIKALHFPHRDSSFLSFPSFETTSRFDPGMSGAPILNDRGGVIGVVCSSFGELPDGHHLSYGSLIGPALFLEIDAAEGKGFLYDFVTGGSVSVDSSIDTIKVTRRGKHLEIDFGLPPIFDAELSVQH